MGCCQEGSRRCAVKIASNTRQCRQADFCMFSSTYMHSCQVSQKYCSVGVSFGSQMVTVVVSSCEHGAGDAWRANAALRGTWEKVTQTAKYQNNSGEK